MMSKDDLCAQCTHEDVCMYKEELIKKQREIDATMEEADMKLFKRPHIGCMKYQQKYTDTVIRRKGDI